MTDTLDTLRASLADRYAIERVLGRGGMATVFLARDVKHDRAVAIKVLHPELSASIGADRFEREIRLAAKLQHPNILGLYDSGSTEGLLYFVMPFIQGESLRDRLDRDGQLPIDDAVQYTLEIADALGYAHAQNIVHRDIKPENILISNGHALVADFGIARAAHESGGQKLTQTGMAIGTPVYMAPEQAAGETVGPTADIYSLGCLLYELLAGEPPFTGKNAMAIMARHAMETVPSIRIVRNSVPEEVEEAIFAAMAKTPTDRPQSAAQFTEILGVPLGATANRRVAMRHTATRRVPTSTYPAVAPPVDTRRRNLLIGGVALLAVLGSLAIWRFGFQNRGPVAAAAPAAADAAARRVAVQYFDDQSSDSSLAFLADGLTEELIGRLSQVTGLTVISRNGVQPFRNPAVSPDSVVQALDVGTLIRGDVERSGDKINVNVSLFDGASGSVYSRAGFEQPATDLLAVRDTLANKVAELIRVRIGEEIKLQAQRQGTRSVEAWSLVQRAERARKEAEVAARQQDSVARDRQFAVADSLLARAEALDPTWAEPVVLRGLVGYRRSRLSGFDQDRVKQWIDTGLTHIERAIAMDRGSADAFEIRGNLRYWTWLLNLEPDAARAKALLELAKKDLDTATGLNQAQAGAWASLSHLHYNYPGSGVVDINLAARAALRADAFLENAEDVLYRLFTSSYDAQQRLDATQWCDETRRRFPRSENAVQCQLYLLTMKDQDPSVIPGAWALADSGAALAGSNAAFTRLHLRMMVAFVLARAGQGDSAKRVVERSKGDPELDPTRDLNLFGAFTYAHLADTTKAIDMLKVYFAANDRARSAFAQDPGWQFRNLANDPRFRTLVGAK
ncbi:MAG: protein kinase domain-containing protein [Gemmatimonadales bacterium]